MLAIILRRLLYAVPVALGLSVVCFSLVHLAPGNPANHPPGRRQCRHHRADRA